MGWLLVENRLVPALELSLVAAATDLLDGYLARRLNASSKTGVYLDPAADKILLVTAFVCLGVIGKIPVWLVALVMGRDLTIVIGSALLWRLRGRSDFTPALTGKISTVFQILTILAILLTDVFPLKFFADMRLIGFAGTCLFTCVSGAIYIQKGIRMARRQSV